MKAIFECKSLFHCRVEKLFQFHEEPIGFETLVGLDKTVQVTLAPKSISEIGTKAVLEVNIFPFIKTSWIAEHIYFEKNKKFIDIQRKGPFKYFCHEHRFEERGEYSLLNDHIEFEFYFNPIAKYFINQKLSSQFINRHAATANYLQIKYENQFCGLV